MNENAEIIIKILLDIANMPDRMKIKMRAHHEVLNVGTDHNIEADLEAVRRVAQTIQHVEMTFLAASKGLSP